MSRGEKNKELTLIEFTQRFSFKIAHAIFSGVSDSCFCPS